MGIRFVPGQEPEGLHGGQGHIPLLIRHQIDERLHHVFVTDIPRLEVSGTIRTFLA